MSTRTDPFSINSPLQIQTNSFSFMDEKSFPLTKRFRPSVQCAHVKKETNESCLADGFMECVHCERVCCLKHITEHQNELKTIRDKLVQDSDEIYLVLTEMQSVDPRQELRHALDLWKKRMFLKIEKTHSELLEDVDDAFVAVTSEFEAKKKGIAQRFEEEISSKLERLSKKNDFYPHELDDLRSSLKQMTGRIYETQSSVINIDYGSGITSILDDEQNQSFDIDEDFQIPRIVIQTKPDVECLLNKSFIREFRIDFEENSIANHFLYDTSNKYLLISNNANETFQLFNHEERIGLGLWPKEFSSIHCVKWSSYLNTFLILSSQTLHSLDCSQQPFHIVPITQINPLTGVPMKHLTVHHSTMFIKHGNGTFIDYFSLKKMKLIQRWSKSDFYKYDEATVDIHRIEFYANSYLAMNVELNEENDLIDIFLLPNLQHIRRIDNSYLILYLPTNNYWIIKEKLLDDNRTRFALLDQHGRTTPINIDQNETISDIRLFGKQFFLVFRPNSSALKIQLSPIDHL